MLEIAAGIILAYIGVQILTAIADVMNTNAHPTQAMLDVKQRKLDKQTELVLEGYAKHQAWEAKHPIARHIYKYDAKKYVSNNI